MVQRLSIIAIAALFLVGCAETGGVDAWVKPIYISKDDRLTESTAKQILIHNESVEAIDE